MRMSITAKATPATEIAKRAFSAKRLRLATGTVISCNLQYGAAHCPARHRRPAAHRGFRAERPECFITSGPCEPIPWRVIMFSKKTVSQASAGKEAEIGVVDRDTNRHVCASLPTHDDRHDRRRLDFRSQGDGRQ